VETEPHVGKEKKANQNHGTQKRLKGKLVDQHRKIWISSFGPGVDTVLEVDGTGRAWPQDWKVRGAAGSAKSSKLEVDLKPQKESAIGVRCGREPY